MAEEETGEGAPVRRGAATIHDVARVAGVSSMTVSRVINGQRYVSAATRDKVTAAVAALHFSPNAAASNLRNAVKIGIVYTNPNSSNLGDFLMGAFRQSTDSGCQLIIEPSAAHACGVSAVSKLLALGIDGVILPPPLCDAPDVLARLAEAGVPALGFATAEPKPGSSAVLIDDFAGASLMTEHLIALGHRDIAFVRGDPEHSPAVRREQGFRDAMANAGLGVREDRVAQGYFTYRSGLDAAHTLLDRPDRPTAIFASNDDMAAAVAAVAHGLGLAIPADISVAGFDDTPVATTVWPELTTIRQPIADMASSAVAILTDQVRRGRSGEHAAPRHDRIDFTLVERASTGAPPVQR